MNLRSTFEMLPDEIMLYVCQYLDRTDVLYSFANLNDRFTQTIADYYKCLCLTGYGYQKFDYVVSEVVPHIGASVRCLLLNGNWMTIMPPKAFTILFQLPISSTFTKLQHLILKWFSADALISFLNAVQDIPNLTRLDVQFLRGNAPKTLLSSILGANSKRLVSVFIDQHSIGLNPSYEDGNTLFPNIKELAVNLKQCRMMPCLFQLVPNVNRLHVHISRFSFSLVSKSSPADVLPLNHLTEFCLFSADTYWTFEELSSILVLMPSLKTLTLHFLTKDKRLTNSDTFSSVLPTTIQQIHLFISFELNEKEIETTVSIDSWKLHSSIKYILCEVERCILFYSVPCNLKSLEILATVGKHMPPGWHYMQEVQELLLYGATSLNEIISILSHFRRIRKLEIGFDKTAVVSTKTSTTTASNLRLPFLKYLSIYGICELYDLVSASQNLNHLSLTYNCCLAILNDKATCDLLKQQITRLDIHNWIVTESSQLLDIVQVFTNIRHLILVLKDPKIIIDSIPLMLLSFWTKQNRLSLSINGSLSDEVKKNLRQWLIDNTNFTVDDSFGIEYKDGWFDLWL